MVSSWEDHIVLDIGISSFLEARYRGVTWAPQPSMRVTYVCVRVMSGYIATFYNAVDDTIMRRPSENETSTSALAGGEKRENA